MKVMPMARLRVRRMRNEKASLTSAGVDWAIALSDSWSALCLLAEIKGAKRPLRVRNVQMERKLLVRKRMSGM